MPNLFGLLQVPMPAPADPRAEAVGDPLLDMVAAYFKAVLNADIGVAWASVFPARGKAGSPAGSALPVPFTATHDPEEAAFSSNKTPCLYVYRLDEPAPVRIRTTQEWEVVRSPIACLLVPPPPTQDKQRLRINMRNAVDKSMREAVRDAKHAAWIVPGDTTFDAATAGSAFLRHARLQSWSFGGVKRHPIVIEDEDGNKSPPYPGLLATILVDEMRERGTETYSALADVRGTITVGDPALALAAYEFLTSLTSVAPTTGTALGGTSITIRGKQFFLDADGAGLSVATSDGVELEDVELVDETTLTATMPPHDAGVVGLVVTVPSGATAVLPNAFTFV